MSTSGERLVAQVVRESGVHLVSLRHTSKNHLKAKLRNDMQQEMHYVFAGTTCSNRTYRNSLADLKRFARGQFITPERHPS